MKFIKKVLIGFLVFILIDLLGLLALSFSFKKVLVNGVIKEMIIMEITNEQENNTNDSSNDSVTDSNNYSVTEENINQVTDNEEVRKLLNSKEVENLINKYLDLTIDSIIDEDNLNEIELEKDMIKFLEDNKSDLEKVVGEEITDEALSNTKEQLETKDMSKEYKQTIRNIQKDLTPTEKSLLKAYKTLISLSFRLIIITLIILDIVFIALLQKSLHKWIKNLSQAFIISGVLLIIMSLAGKLIVETASELKTFNINSLLTIGIIYLIIGIITIIIYKFIFKDKDNNKENNSQEVQYDISQASTE